MDLLAAVRAHLGAQFDTQAQSASVTFLGLEPIEVLRFPGDGHTSYITIGCSRHPMTDPAAAVADPVRGPRAELVLRLRGAGVPGLHMSLAILAATPAVEGVVLRPDALLDLGEPLWPGSACTAVLLGPETFEPLEPGGDYDPVRFFGAIPITATEAAWVRIRGAAALREAWAEASVDPTDPARPAVTPN